MQEKILGEYFFREYMYFLHISQILEGNYFGAYTCRACIRTRANTGKYFWGIIYVLVRRTVLGSSRAPCYQRDLC